MRIENFGFVQKAPKFGIKLAKLRLRLFSWIKNLRVAKRYIKAMCFYHFMQCFDLGTTVFLLARK